MLVFTLISLALIISLINSVIIFYAMKSYSEKFTLLSHIALQFLNEKESSQAKQELTPQTVVAPKSPLDLRRSR